MCAVVHHYHHLMHNDISVGISVIFRHTDRHTHKLTESKMAKICMVNVQCAMFVCVSVWYRMIMSHEYYFHVVKDPLYSCVYCMYDANLNVLLALAHVWAFCNPQMCYSLKYFVVLGHTKAIYRNKIRYTACTRIIIYDIQYKSEHTQKVV